MKKLISLIILVSVISLVAFNLKNENLVTIAVSSIDGSPVEFYMIKDGSAVKENTPFVIEIEDEPNSIVFYYHDTNDDQSRLNVKATWNDNEVNSYSNRTVLNISKSGSIGVMLLH